MATDAPRRSSAQSQAEMEDSEVIVHIFRAAFIASFVFGSAAASRTSSVPWHPSLWITAALAGSFTVLVLAPVVSRTPVFIPRGIRRVLALLIDLNLNTHFMLALNTDVLFPIYYLLVFVGAVWFRVPGAVGTALAALALRVGAHWAAQGAQPGWASLVGEVQTQGPILLAIALVVGYAMRGREQERRHAFRLEQELLAARHIQDQMLPRALRPPEGYDIAARFEPSRGVGGDYYDSFALADGRLGICVADVAGKSLPALIVLAGFRAILYAEARRATSPALAVVPMNEASLASLPEDSFVAVFYAALEPKSGELTYVNCGHVPPLLQRHAPPGRSELLTTGDIVLGVLPSPGFTEQTVVLEPGDFLVCATDGLLEARDAEGRMFDQERVAALLAEIADASADEIAATLLSAARQHARHWGEDDVTILVLKRWPVLPQVP